MDFSWGLLIFILGAMTYGAWSIMREKDLYLSSAIDSNLSHFSFLLPAWWSNSDQLDDNPNHNEKWIFKRTDTEYDWRAGIGLLESQSLSTMSFHLEELCHRLDLIFDEHFLAELPWKNPNMDFEYSRREGPATRHGDERVYADILLVKHRTSGETTYLWSVSSILNGCVEGPYFEEVIKRMRYCGQFLDRDLKNA